MMARVMIPALRRRLASAIHRLGNRLDPSRHWLPTPSMAEETERWRKELEAEAIAEFWPHTVSSQGANNPYLIARYAATSCQ